MQPFQVIDNIERIVLDLLRSLVNDRTGVVRVPQIRGRGGGGGGLSSNQVAAYRQVSYRNKSSRHRFCLIVYALAQVHSLHLNGGSCTIRGLYYSNVQLIRSQSKIVAAELDVCRMLNSAPGQLGILPATKGLMAGNIQMYMTNGDVLDWSSYTGGLCIPTDFNKVDRIETRAQIVLVVEKEAVFESLLSRNIFGNSFGNRVILITGKGYPDCCTRRTVHRLAIECQLPVYILVDADPYGIEIMLVYRHGSKELNFTSSLFATPMIRWIGLHPSEIQHLSCNNVAPLNAGDNKRICDILRRDDISWGVRQELLFMQRQQLKAEIESVLDILAVDYIPNKIMRDLFL